MEEAIPVSVFVCLFLIPVCTFEHTATPLPLLEAWEGEETAGRCYRVHFKSSGSQARPPPDGPVLELPPRAVISESL